MKKLITCLFIIYVGVTFANPIQPGPAINEIFFDESGWQIEIVSINLPGNLDYCAISGVNGYSEFNPGIAFDANELVVVTVDDLQDPFEFNPECDSILTYTDIVPFCYCEYGQDNQGVMNPFLGQSLRLESFYIDQYSIYYRYCKDNSPTIGTINDSTDYKCFVSGNIFDAQMNSVPYAEISVVPSNYYDPQILSNELGQYSMCLYALKNEIEIKINNIVYLDTLISIEPGECSIDFFLEDYIPSAAHETVTPKIDYSLTNHPNPFNPSTEIRFQISDFSNQNLEIHIFNSKGQKIRQFTIFNNQSSITWDGTNSIGKTCPSGVYLYKLVSGEKELAVNKMLLLK